MRSSQLARANKKERKRIRVAQGIILALFCCVAFNQLRIQAFGRGRIIQAADFANRREARVEIAPKRGAIYSSDNVILAKSSDRFHLQIDARKNRTPLSPGMLSELASATDISAAELMDFISNERGGGEWEAEITRAQANRVVAVKRRYRADGIAVTTAGTRDYSMGENGAGLIGFVAEEPVSERVELGAAIFAAAKISLLDTSHLAGEQSTGEGTLIGRSGLEEKFESRLAGTRGMTVGMRDRDGEYLPWLMSEEKSRPTVNGEDIVLTINSDLQKVAAEALAKTCEQNGAENGAAVVLDPKSGDILAIASWPSFDPHRPEIAFSDFHKGLRTSPEINPAVGLTFEPGSVFKLFTIANAIDRGIISANSTVYCNGSKQFSDKVVHCAGDHKTTGHGSVGISRCVEASCNVAAASWGAQVGYDGTRKMIHELGLLRACDVGLPSAAAGRMNTSTHGRSILCATVGFGQSIIVTPLSLASAFSVFANEGKRVEPRLVKSIGGKNTPQPVANEVFASDTANRLLKDMSLVFEGQYGTARSLRIAGYTLAGKTGTAEKQATLHSGTKKYVSSFVGYFPATKPKAVILVMVDSPSKGLYYGAQVAGPAYKEIVNYLIQAWNVPPDRLQELASAVR